MQLPVESSAVLLGRYEVMRRFETGYRSTVYAVAVFAASWENA